MGNFGDDLLMSAAIRGVQHVLPDANCTVLCPPVGDVPARYSAGSTSHRIYQQAGWRGRAARLAPILRETPHARAIAWSGGMLGPPASPHRARILAAAARLRRIPLIGLGLSMERAATPQEARRVPFGLLTMRDEQSYLWATEAWPDSTVSRAADLAGCLPPFAPPKGPATNLAVAATESLLASMPEAALVEGICAASEERAAGTVRVFALDGHDTWGDKAAAVRLAECLRATGHEAEVIQHAGKPLDAAAQLGSCKAVLTGRLHGAIVAYLSGRPFIALENSAKMSNFLNDIGHPKQLRWHNLATFQEACRNMATARPPTLSIEEYRNRSWQSFGALHDFLEAFP